ncbi:DUF1583 domain-containing protein [Roseiconus nitratireducens]|uniref:DUF1583 domain-containing protein n=1 Tax=Roseiconus nitratireducens TaxID=2605748 RepID=UPI001375E262|nr:DUF1583 domain-containing protein [Roseiconus nitratireducens]
MIDDAVIGNVLIGDVLIGDGASDTVASDRLTTHATHRSPPSDSAALAQLIGESVLAGNAAAVCDRSRTMPAESKLKALSEWVLPGNGHGFRLGGTFRRGEGRSIDRADPAVTDLRDFPESEWIASPARQLIRVAQQLGRLDDLRKRLQRFRPVDPRQQKNQATLLTLIEIVSGDASAVAKRLDDRFAAQRKPEDSDAIRQGWCDLLVLWMATEEPRTSHLVRRDLFGAFGELQYYQPDPQLDVLYDYLRLLAGRVPTDPGDSGTADRTPQSEFEVFSRVDAATHGLARPLPRFRIDSQGATKISGHEVDYLAYRGAVPSAFEINCDVATRPGAFSELMVHGVSAKPIRGNQKVSLGRDAKGDREIELSPPAAPTETESHLRVTVHDAMTRHEFNGRVLFEHSAEGSPVPWAAIRSWRRTASEIRNVHLIGSGAIPESIALLADQSLSGWASYYQSDIHAGLGNWNAVIGSDQSLELLSESTAAVPGSFQEELLYYVRPISWDAQIRYEFRYEPGVAMVHPAVGQIAFLISPDGVRLHRLTDGKYERSTSRPDATAPMASDTDAAYSPPDLRRGWNQAELRLSDGAVGLWLNGRFVGRRTISDDQSRTFGLFHYRDQTRAVVRNVVLSGDWPQRIPAIDQQPMASERVAQLDAAGKALPERFSHDFRTGVPPELFDFEGDETSVTPNADGVRVLRTPAEGVRSMRLCGMIDGDFDIIAGYKDLQISDVPATWHCGIGLAFNLENKTLDRCAINRRRGRMEGRHYVAFTQKETDPGGKLEWIGSANVVDESTSGRLRLVRKGGFVYGLHAVGDSPTFRLVKTTQVPPGRIAIHGLRLITEVGKGMQTSATWTHLSVRAEQIDLLQPKDSAATIAKLNAVNRSDPNETIDLTDQTTSEAGLIANSGENLAVTSGPEGATIMARGGDRNGRCQLWKRLDLGAEFDIVVDFEVNQLESDHDERSSGEVFFQVFLEDADGTVEDPEAPRVREATLILRQKWTGALDLRPRVVARGRGGKTLYLPIRTVPVEMPRQFRIAQRNQTLYFMYCQEDSEETTVIATYPLDDRLHAAALVLGVIAAENQHTTRAVLKRIQLFGSPAPRKVPGPEGVVPIIP